MGIDDRIFEKEKIGKLLLRFALPAIISLLVQELYAMVDTVYVGRFIGSDAIAALTVAFPIQRLLISLGLLIAVGGSTYVSMNLGRGDKETAGKAVVNSFIIGIVMLSITAALCGVFLKPMLFRLGASSSTYPMARGYVAIILTGGVFQAITAIACYIMTVLGDSKITLHSNSLGAILNIIINGVLFAGLGLGVEGAAIATVISQIAAFIFAAIRFRKAKKYLKISFSLKSLRLSMSGKVMAVIITTGFSSFIIEISDALSSTVLNNVLLFKGGDDAITLLGTVTKISMFMYITIIGISSAMQPIVAYNFGAGNMDRVRKTVKTTLKAVLASSMVMWAGLMIMAPRVIGIFLTDEALKSQAVPAFRIAISMIPFAGVCYVALYYLQSVKQPGRSLMLSLSRMVILFIPISFVLTMVMGVTGTWISYPICDLIAAIMGFIAMRKLLARNVMVIKQKSLQVDRRLQETLLKGRLTQSYSFRPGRLEAVP
jgi:putative MATE family efflux protein